MWFIGVEVVVQPLLDPPLPCYKLSILRLFLSVDVGCSLELGMFLEEATFSSLDKSPSKIMFRETVSAATVINRVS